MHVRCPHCHNPLKVLDDASLSDIECASCGSSFSLVGDVTETVTHRHETKTIGHFQLVRQLGVGAFGSVWQAKDTQLDRTVAIKIPRKGQLHPDEAEQFLREARTAAQLKHPNIVSVHEVGREDDQVYIVSDFVDGVTLSHRLSAGPLAARDAAELSRQIADALHHAHEAGVVHRDLKPSNVMLDENGEPHVMDFKLAKRETGEVTMTIEGQILGTPAYMSPEQAAGFGHKVDRRSDIYSLGVVLYELLCGETPFRGSKVMMMHQVLHEDPRPPRRVNDRIPRDLETICLKAMAKEPRQRYATAHALAIDIGRFLNGETIDARPVGTVEKAWKWAKRRPAAAGLLATGLVASLALVGVGVGFFYSVRLARALESANSARMVAEQARVAESAERERTETARAQAELYLYFNRIVLAEHEWQANNVLRAEQLLDVCPADLRGWEWHYLKRLCHAELHTFDAHSTAVNALAVSPDGRLMASSSDDMTIKLWDLGTRQEVGTFSGHTRKVESLAFSPDGKRLVSGAGDFSQAGEVIIWETAAGEQLLRLEEQTGQDNGVAFSPDGERIAVASGEWGRARFVKVFEADTGKELHTMPVVEQAPVCVRFSPDGTQLAAAIGTWNAFDLEQKPGFVQVWDTSGAELFKLEGHTGPVTSLAYSPDGRRLASTGWDRCARVWDVAARREILTLRGFAHWASGIAFSWDGKRIASGSEDASAKIWDATTGQELMTLRGHSGAVPAVEFCKDGSHLVTGSDDGTAKLWDTAFGPEARLLGEFGAWVTSVAFSANAQRVAAGAVDRRLIVWNANSGDVQLDLRDLPNSVWSVRFAPDGRRIAVGLGDWTKPGQLAEIKILDVTTGREYHTLRGHGGLVWSLAFSPDGQRLATAGGELNTGDAVKVWNVLTGEELQTLPSPNHGVPAVSFSPDGRFLTAAIGNTVQIWDAENWFEVATLTGHTEVVLQLVFSPDSSQIASCGADRTVRLWDVSTGEQAHVFDHPHYVTCVAFSPEGSRIASGTFDHAIRLWDRSTGQQILTLRGHTGAVQSIAFSPDGQRLISGSHDRTAKLWEAARLDK